MVPLLGVTVDSIKVVVSLVDFECIKDFVDDVRLDQDKIYGGALFKDINDSGGINGRKIEPVFKTYCPIRRATELTRDLHLRGGGRQRVRGHGRVRRLHRGCPALRDTLRAASGADHPRPESTLDPTRPHLGCCSVRTSQPSAA